MSGFLVPSGTAQDEHEVKKSRFIAHASYASSREEAMSFLDGIKKEYPDARHHCWAYLLGNPRSPNSAAMNDAGEPSGTAGRPILNVLEHKALGNVMVVVVRYFGGVKLGAGGLVRAYSAAAQKVMEALPVKSEVPKVFYTLLFDFKYEQSVRHRLENLKGIIINCEYNEKVIMDIEVPVSFKDELKNFASAKGIMVVEVDI